MMLSLYIFCLVIGGVFVGLAALAGIDGVDFDPHFDFDIELKDNSAQDEADDKINFRKHRRRQRLGLPFFNLRFWTFGCCFFGLTGTLLTYLNPTLSSLLIFSVSLAVGVFCGTAIVWTLVALKHQQGNSLIRSQDLIGASGIVEIPFDDQSKGKVRLNIKGVMIDFIAVTQENRELAKGEQVLIVGLENNKVWVISHAALEEESESSLNPRN